MGLNPKPETRNPNECLKPETPIEESGASSFGFGAWGFIRISGFGFLVLEDVVETWTLVIRQPQWSLGERKDLASWRN
jgi:hypothetical protein